MTPYGLKELREAFSVVPPHLVSAFRDRQSILLAGLLL